MPDDFPAPSKASQSAPSDARATGTVFRRVARLTLLAAFVGVLAGGASALFLSLLDLATATRGRFEFLVYALPAAGFGLGKLYARYGTSIQGGTNLVLDTLHEGGAPIPTRMAPMVLVGAVLTHLFGGSAGREGTAVQMGASLGEAVATRARADASLRRALLAAGVAGGFGSVFGTPFAGALFALEFLVLGELEFSLALPAFVAAFVGDAVTTSLGVTHTAYPRPPATPLDLLLLGKWILFAAAVALATIAFVELTEFLKRRGKKLLPDLGTRMALGGAVVVVLWKLAGTSDYLGLGVPTILRAFEDPNLPGDAFAWKLVFTAVTLGAGFLGGEVTPLFFVGAALGNLLASLLGLPLPLAAAVGLASVFGAAANAPLALAVMAVELVSWNVLPHVALVAPLAFLLTGRRGIYAGQRVRAKEGGVRRVG